MPTLIYGGPPALPGSCYICSSSQRERFIDFNTQIEFHGAFYLCELCVIESAQILGMLTENQSEELNIKLLKSQVTTTELKKEVTALKRLVDGLDAIRSYADGFSGAKRSSLPESEESQAREDGVVGGEEGSPKSADDKGMAELRTASSKSKPRSTI